MAFREVTGGSNIKSYWPKKAAERKEGDSVEGIYRKRMERKNPDGTDSVLYLLENKDGELIGVNSSATITRAMEQIPYDTMVRIEYHGQARSQKTGRTYNDFRVFMDDASQSEAEEPLDLQKLDF